MYLEGSWLLQDIHTLHASLVSHSNNINLHYTLASLVNHISSFLVAVRAQVYFPWCEYEVTKEQAMMGGQEIAQYMDDIFSCKRACDEYKQCLSFSFLSVPGNPDMG